MGFPANSAAKESPCNEGDPSLISGLERSTREGISYPLQYSWASLVIQLVKNLHTMLKTWVQSLVGKIPWRRERLPTAVFWPGEFHRLGSHGITKSQTQLSDFHFDWEAAVKKIVSGDLFPEYKSCHCWELCRR